MMSGIANTATKIDSVFLFIVSCLVVLLVLVTFFMVFFVIRYSRKRNPNPEQIEGNVLLEIIWTVIPTVLVLVMFYAGWSDFSYIRNPPDNAMPVQVTGMQWSWQFEYKNGKQSNVLNVPLGKPVKLILTSADVIHSLFIPAFRIKEDAVPGLKTHLWFKADELGSFDIFCTEYCGTGHSHMLSKVVVMADNEFDKWYESAEAAGAKERGMNLLQVKGCLGCHTTDGTKKIGPTFKGLFGRKETVITDGREHEIIVDEAFIRKAVLQPGADLVKGYPKIMPKLPVTPEELDAIVATLKELK
ncbi:MAG TPA: cytochrome c oxidase subunit II [Dissulfurispiraceae bacterium]|nr:cytochrome c oxidase subunit II [Dissulfurispiraceae bacterium]